MFSSRFIFVKGTLNLVRSVRIIQRQKSKCFFFGMWKKWAPTECNNVLSNYGNSQGHSSTAYVAKRLQHMQPHMTTVCHTSQKEVKLFKVWVLTFITNQNKNTMFLFVYLLMFQFHIANKTRSGSSSPLARCAVCCYPKFGISFHFNNNWILRMIP